MQHSKVRENFGKVCCVKLWLTNVWVSLDMAIPEFETVGVLKNNLAIFLTFHRQAISLGYCTDRVF